MAALRFKQPGDVMGVCPQCGSKVPVYANGTALRMRPHGYTLPASESPGAANRKVSCPVQGVDAGPALDLAVASQESALTAFKADVAALKTRVATRDGTPPSPPPMAPRVARHATKGGA